MSDEELTPEEQAEMIELIKQLPAGKGRPNYKMTKMILQALRELMKV